MRPAVRFIPKPIGRAALEIERADGRLYETILDLDLDLRWRMGGPTADDLGAPPRTVGDRARDTGEGVRPSLLASREHDGADDLRPRDHRERHRDDL